MSKQKVSDIIIEVLEQAGVQRCYGIVGDTLNHVTDSMSKSSIEWIHVRHEEVGGFAAGTDALLSGHLTACAGSCGPGSLHFINGLYESHRNRAPVILIASQISTEMAGFIDFPQYVDFKSVYEKNSVFCEEITQASQARHIMSMACQAAINKRGVAVVIVPANISEASAEAGLPFVPRHAEPDILPNQAELQQMVELISQHQKIGIYAGAGCEGAHDQLVAFAEKLKAPIAHTSRAKDFVEYDNPYNMGMTGIFGNKAGYHTLMDCDLLILLGADFAWAQYYPSHAKILQIDIDPTHLGRRHPITLGAVGKISSTLNALLPLLQTRQDRAFLDHCLELKHQSDEIRHKEERVGKEGLIHPQYLVSLLNRYADDDAIFFGDGGPQWYGYCVTWMSMANAVPLPVYYTVPWPMPCLRRWAHKKRFHNVRSSHSAAMVV